MTGAAPLPLWVLLLAAVSMAAAAADPAPGSHAQAPAVHARTPGAAPGQDDDAAAAAPRGTAAQAQPS